jgi:hypothetical protein
MLFLRPLKVPGHLASQVCTPSDSNVLSFRDIETIEKTRFHTPSHISKRTGKLHVQLAGNTIKQERHDRFRRHGVGHHETNELSKIDMTSLSRLFRYLISGSRMYSTTSLKKTTPFIKDGSGPELGYPIDTSRAVLFSDHCEQCLALQNKYYAKSVFCCLQGSHRCALNTCLRLRILVEFLN